MPTLSNANLQAAQRAASQQQRLQSNSQAPSSLSHSIDQLGRLPAPSVMRQSKRNSVVSSQGDHFSHTYYPSHAKLENTFRLGPSDSQRFNVSRVQSLVSDILQNHLENMAYDHARCKDMSMKLSDEIKTRIRSIVYKRYKLIVNVTLGQNLGNSIIIASRSLWNAETDNGCTVQFKNSSLYAIVTIFAAYYD
mgnify:CR=1 FL=1